MENKTIYLQNDIDLFNFSEEGDKALIEGRATRFNNTNLNHQVVDKNSFNSFFKLWNEGTASVQMNYEHTYDKIIGGVDEIEAKEDGLYVKAHLNREIPFVSEWLLPNIKNHDITGLSTEGYVLNGPDGISWIDKNTYYVKDFILSALAVTTHPADVEAKFSLANAVEQWQIERETKSKWYFLA